MKDVKVRVSCVGIDYFSWRNEKKRETSSEFFTDLLESERFNKKELFEKIRFFNKSCFVNWKKRGRWFFPMV